MEKAGRATRPSCFRLKRQLIVARTAGRHRPVIVARHVIALHRMIARAAMPAPPMPRVTVVTLIAVGTVRAVRSTRSIRTLALLRLLLAAGDEGGKPLDVLLIARLEVLRAWLLLRVMLLVLRV